MDKKIKELQEAFGRIQKDFAKIKGYSDSAPVVSADDCSYLYNLIGNLSDRIGYLSDTFYSHINSGHIPPAKSASQMQGILNKLNLDKDYQAQQPQVVYASTRNGIEATVNYMKPKV